MRQGMQKGAANFCTILLLFYRTPDQSGKSNKTSGTCIFFYS